MFQRNPTLEPKTIERRTARPGANGAQSHLSAPSSGDKSVIGNDLKIMGQGLKSIGRGTLQVDGEIEGDVQAVEVIIGEQGKVTGMVAGQQVVVRGKVSGVVCAKNVALQSSSEVQGESRATSIICPSPCRAPCLKAEAVALQARPPSIPSLRVGALSALTATARRPMRNGRGNADAIGRYRS